MKTLMNHSQDGGLLKMISRDPVIFKKVLCFFFCLFTDIHVDHGVSKFALDIEYQ